MAAHGNFRGHPMHFDESSQGWVFDDGGLVREQWRERPCGHCGLPDTPEGHDGCLGTLPGVRNACCGHGDAREAYVQFCDGSEVRGKEAVNWIAAVR